MQELSQERLSYILNTREKISKYDSNTILNEITQMISNPNKIAEVCGSSKIFSDHNNAILCKELLRGLVYSQKNDNIQATKKDVKKFVRIMNESNNRSVYSLLINQMLNINSEEKNKVETKDESAMVFDSLNIDHMFDRSSELVENDDTIYLSMLNDPEEQFYKALFYNYINKAQTVSPKLAYAILSELVNTEEIPVTNLKQLNAQLKEYLNFNKYKDEVIENHLKLIAEKVQKSSAEEQHKTELIQMINEISNKYSEESIKDNAEEMIKAYNTARNRMKNHFEALPNVILSINVINKKLEEQAKN